MEFKSKSRLNRQHVKKIQFNEKLWLTPTALQKSNGFLRKSISLVGRGF